MKNHSTVRLGVRVLCAVLFSSAICAAWPAAAQAKGSFKRASTTSGTSGNVSGKWNTTHTPFSREGKAYLAPNKLGDAHSRQLGRALAPIPCPLSGAKRTSASALHMLLTQSGHREAVQQLPAQWLHQIGR